MLKEESFEKRYKDGDTPWDTGKPDFNLIHAVTSMSIKPCKALDIGCGTGNNSIWLAQNDFDVIGIDTSEVATQKAAEKAADIKGNCTFLVVNFLKQNIEKAPFGFAFDRGCFHTLDSHEERRHFAEKVAAHLEKDGLWFSIIGNADEVRHHPGPPQRTAADIVNSIEPYFEILSLISSQFESNRPNPPRAWVCLMRKRNNDCLMSK
ncbi:Thiopurine S-methyltransferase (TPMT) [Desulfosporosinus orientis DSM 765]|uniref:Thiopurine S-methyltransferase (TPMT) n=1 Tax=Desulfosporosinus orientis (strain ATCC 19365 / DSM 765 / NCIMB 8382 / VKM B-1628 / Singapore I) TaxID=768706 RepID=G7WIR5_DESOD|nr:class I SAM-dependent methyltransferase [Desulfosporosinus orientis]AET69139.1 Thiopurine S-methyltransferase (TPMT) [Desulfosporosinus orientis DSM 765]